MFRREWVENIILDTALSALPFEPNNLQVKFLIYQFYRASPLVDVTEVHEVRETATEYQYKLRNIPTLKNGISIKKN